jgi:hypothetical protein
LVTAPSVMVRDFVTPNGTLLDQQLVNPELGHDRDDPEHCEYAVAVKWLKTFPMSDAVRFEGMFANQNIVCKLREPRTIDILKERLGFRLE